MRADLFRHEPGWAAAGDCGSERPPVVYRGAVPPGAEIEAVRAASAVRGFRAGGCGGGEVGVRGTTNSDSTPLSLQSRFLSNVNCRTMTLTFLLR